MSSAWVAPARMRWTWASVSPGISVMPRPSTTVAPSPAGGGSPSPTALIFVPSVTTWTGPCAEPVGDAHGAAHGRPGGNPSAHDRLPARRAAAEGGPGQGFAKVYRLPETDPPRPDGRYVRVRDSGTGRGRRR